MGNGKISLLSTIATLYLKNPFFILDSSGEKRHMLHQTETVARSLFLKPTRVLIADVIGLGKTVTALRILEMLRIYDGVSRVLIVVPSILLPQWVEELKHFGITPIKIGRESLEELNRYNVLPPGIYIGTIDRLKREEYYRLIEKEKWDLIIVDEAHKLGFVGGRQTKRLEVLGNFIARSKSANVILLSATPHRGYDYDYLARLYIVDPSLETLGSFRALRRVSRRLDSGFYSSTHNVILHRRNKEDINRIYEGREVFKKCYMLAILIKPSKHEEEMLSSLIEVGEKGVAQYYNELAQKGYFDPAKVIGVTRLLRKLIIKRGLSSPKALVETFGKMVKKRGEIMKKLDEQEEFEEVKRLVEEKIPEFEKRLEDALDPEAEPESEEEEEYDRVFNEIAESVAAILPRRYIEKTSRAVSIARDIVEGRLVDSKLETLKKLIEETLKDHEEGMFKDLKGAKVVVFTEFKDTAHYIYSKLREWLKSRYGEKDADKMIKVITSEERNKYDKIVKWFRESQYAKILVTTDVLGEGLNLQAANVLVNYEITYSPVRLEQRIGRIWRIGQERNCYVFNLFYVHGYEKDVFETIFMKLYGINDAIGRQEITLGDEIYISTVGDSLFEKVVKERLGEEYAGYSRYLGSLMPVSIKREGKEIRLTESEVIEAVFEKRLSEIVEDLIMAIIYLAKTIRENNIYPEPLARNTVEEFLKRSFGIANSDEAIYIARKLMEIYRDTTTSQEPILKDRPDLYLKYIKGKGETLDPGSRALFLAFQSDKKKLYVLAIASIEIRNETRKEPSSPRRYVEPILVELDVEAGSAAIHRGRDLVDMLSKLLPDSLEVDEVYGADKLVRDEWLKAIDYVKSEIQDNYSAKETGYNDMAKKIRVYEDTKRNIGASEFFRNAIRVSEVRPLAFFVSVGLFPTSTAVPETGVWFGFENRYLRDVVLKYEESNGRRADIERRLEEHYDVYSYSDEEERYIDIKGFAKPRLELGLTEREYQKACELGDNFWLYLVYGVGTENPVMLCIRNPAEKVKFSKIEATVTRREYVWRPGKAEL